MGNRGALQSHPVHASVHAIVHLAAVRFPFQPLLVLPLPLLVSGWQPIPELVVVVVPACFQYEDQSSPRTDAVL